MILTLTLLFLQASAQSLPPCSATDYSYSFSECIEDKRNLIFYFPSDQCETNDAVSLPSNIKGLSCLKECDKGEYLGYDDANHIQACMKCPANTYSLGGGMRIDGALREWAQPDIFKNMKEGGCASAQYRFSDYSLIHGCEGWASSAEGKYIQTELPANAENDKYYDLWFKLGMRTVKPGSVRFEFKKDTETEYLGIFNNGELSFIVNDVVEAQYDSKKHSTSDQDWQKIEYYLSPGFHDLMWLYRFHYKNHKELKAQIRKIEVDGIDYAHTYCKACLFGQSEEGSYSCSTCAQNYYLSTDSEKCQKCPDGKLSTPGASGLSSCIDPPVCRESDYEKTVEGCKEGMRGVTYKWVESGGTAVCKEGDVALPHNGERVSESCPSCQPGSFLSVASDSTQTCEYCDMGTYISESHRSETSCQTCPNNQIALRSLEFDQFFNPLYPELTLQCISTDLDTISNDCLHLRGLRIENGTLTTGSPVPGGVVLSLMTVNPLDFQCNLTSHQIVTHYSFSGQPRSDVKFELLIDGAVEVSFPLQGNSPKVHTYQIEHGQHELSWRYTSSQSDTDLAVTIHSILIEGVKNGGGVRCIDCPTGHYAAPNQAECFACPSGHQPTALKDTCEICPEGKFNPFQGSECRACPEMTKSSHNRLSCVARQYFDHQKTDLHRYVLQLFSEEKLTLLNCGNKNATHNCFYPGILGPILTEQGNFYDKSFFISGLSQGQFDKHPSLINIPPGSGAVPGLPAYVYGVFLQEGAFGVEESQSLKLQKHNLGSVIQEAKFNERNDPPTIQLLFAFGDYCDPSLLKNTRQNTSAQEFLRYSSEIELICDRTIESRIVYNPDQQQGCKFGFSWYSKYACARCRVDQMNALLGACAWGTRTITYEVKEGQNCSVFPLVGEEEKRADLIYQWYLFDQPCSDSRDFVRSQMFWVVLVFGILTVLSFTCMMVILCKKYRNIKHNYNRLLENPGRSSDMPPSEAADPGQIELSNM